MATRKVRTLTFKAMESFKEKVTYFEKRLSIKEGKISSALHHDFSSDSVTQLQELADSLNADLSAFKATGVIYINFLTATKTDESEYIKTSFQSHLANVESDVAIFRDNIEKRRQEILEDGLEDVISKSIHSSKCASSEMKLSKMAAAKKGVEFAQKEAELMKEKAELDKKNKEIEASLLILQKEKVAEKLKTEIEILEQEDSSSTDNGSVNFHLPVMDTNEKIEKFFNKDTSGSSQVQNPTFEDFTNYMLKKELTFTRITNFNDSPEYYQVWKTSFHQVLFGMNITSTEELDLLIKYLGPESRKHAISLKTVYRKDQSLGLSKIWERLDERYGAPEIVHKLIQKRIDDFPRLTHGDTTKWYDLDDLLSEILALKEDSSYATSLAYFDSTVGLSSITRKLPGSAQEKWAARAYRYKMAKHVIFPPLKEFVDFIHELAKIRNDPSVNIGTERLQLNTAPPKVAKPAQVVTNRKTEVSNKFQDRQSMRFCPLHQLSHSLNKCRAFRSKSLSERKQFLKENNICFKCCEFNNHKANECRVSINCCVCGNVNHPGALHVDQPPQPSARFQGGENSHRDYVNPKTDYSRDAVANRCTQICGASQNSKSCAKLVLVNVVNTKHSEYIVQCYAMLDEQSNKSLASPKLFDMLQIDSPDFEYTINSCAGTHVAHGRRASGCSVSSVDSSVSYSLPTLIECADIPNNRNEICSPKDVGYHPHLSHIAGHIPEINDQAEILLLIGRDLVEAHHVRDQILGPPGAPFAQHVGLGWVVIGEMCLGKTHSSDVVNANKIHVLNNGRPSLFEPCTSQFHVEDKVNDMYDPIFVRRVDDDKHSLSIEDREFLDIMDHSFRKTTDGKLTAPLPFKSPRQRLPNNRSEAFRRAKSLQVSLQRNPEKRGHMVEFMSKILVNGHAEVAPVLGKDEECWFLPIFGVYNPKKPGKVRAVFDSSSTFHGVSLNSVLLTGPDLTNSLLGVLMRFRRESVAISADIEQMFYCFEVDEVHRNFLRFFWYEDNDVEKSLIEYRMSRHVFGNSPSPAVATYGLCRSVTESDEDIKVFVHNDFYVDDGLTSLPYVQEAVDLLKRTQVALGQSSLRLHKIASNDMNVMRSFPAEDLAKDLISLDFGEILPTQRSLGLGWDLNADCFVFNVVQPAQVPSRRKILSMVNSLFDPLGFLAPFTIVGKLILRDIILEQCNWDDPIPLSIEVKWHKWSTQLHELSSFKVPRSYLKVSLSDASHVELHVFCDASELAISAVVYLVGQSSNHELHVGFVLGKSQGSAQKRSHNPSS